MEKTEKKRPLREDWRLIWRAIKILREIMPGFWTACVLSRLAAALSPYFGLYMSAELVNELAGGGNARRLAVLAAVTVAGSFALSMLGRFLESRKALSELHILFRYREYLFHRQNAFPYQYMEDPDVKLKSAEIEAVANAFQGGLLSVWRNVPAALDYFLNVILSVSLAFSMFMTRGTADSYSNYKCCAYSKRGKEACSGHYIRESQLKAIVLDDLRRVTYYAKQKEKLLLRWKRGRRN